MPCSRKQYFWTGYVCHVTFSSSSFFSFSKLQQMLIHLVCTTKTPHALQFSHLHLFFYYLLIPALLWKWPLHDFRLATWVYPVLQSVIWPGFVLRDRTRRTFCTDRILLPASRRDPAPFHIGQQSRCWKCGLWIIFLRGRLDSSLFFSPASGQAYTSIMDARRKSE